MTLGNDTITGRTDRRTDRQMDRQTDGQSATQYAAPPREEGRIISNRIMRWMDQSGMKTT